MKIRVYYEDTDIGGIVYHANYLKYCERARSELFFSKGKIPIIGNSSFVVSSVEAKFLGQATLGDILEVKTNLIKAKKVSLILLQEIYNNDIKIFSASIKLAFLNNGKPTMIDKEQLTILTEVH